MSLRCEVAVWTCTEIDKSNYSDFRREFAMRSYTEVRRPNCMGFLLEFIMWIPTEIRTNETLNIRCEFAVWLSFEVQRTTSHRNRFAKKSVKFYIKFRFEKLQRVLIANFSKSKWYRLRWEVGANSTRIPCEKKSYNDVLYTNLCCDGRCSLVGEVVVWPHCRRGPSRSLQRWLLHQAANNHRD